MSMTVFIGVRVNFSSFKRIPIHSVSSEMKIDELKNIVSSNINIPNTNLELIYCGNLLENNATLESCGIRPGVTVHALKKKDPEPKKCENFNINAEILNSLYSILVFINTTKTPRYQIALQRLSRPEILENIMAAAPRLAEDPIAVSIIKDPELLIQLGDVNTIKRIVKSHPILAEAAYCIEAAIDEESWSPEATNPGTSSGYSYSLDALSDDEEVDSSQSSDSQPRNGGGENIFLSPITPAQFTAALDSATGNNSNLTQTPSNSVITTEMFNQAMQQVFANVTSGMPSPDGLRGSLSSSNFGDLEATSRQLARQLQQMHELGLKNDTINLQALQATDWNVQEAINLVFSGAIGDTDLDDD